ncbi:hypothetical protein B0H14DRAFT_2969096 [Mycena olivaceomarginata]|nr:hypothetical protein B0H14DRAFT_2969096 [Mycena olivaceomarginata]
MYLVPRGCTRLRSASRTPRTTPPRSALVLGAAPSLRELTLHISISQTLGTMDLIRLPRFLPLRPCISARPWRAIGASLALLAYFPFLVSSYLPLFQSLLRNPIGPGQRQRAGEDLSLDHNTLHADLPAVPRSRAGGSGSAVDAEAASSSPLTPFTPAAAPAAAPAPPHLPTHGLRKASDLPKSLQFHGGGRPRR